MISMANFNEAIMVCSRLVEQGFEGYFVGGFVRDTLIEGISFKFLPMNEKYLKGDIDIATNATPKQVMEVFKDFTVIPVGEKFGTVKIFRPLSEPIEVTTYRSEGLYSDNRHPDTVKFETVLEKDLERRDFTINAIAFEPLLGIFTDPFNGKEDIECKIIRCVGNPNERFKEDPLRMLRMFRFAAKLEFKIELETGLAAHKLASEIQKIPIERVKDELFKILVLSKSYQAINSMQEIGLLKYIIPELDRLVGVKQPSLYHAHDVFGHSLASLQHYLHLNDNPDPLVALVIMLHDNEKLKPNETSPYFPQHEKRSADTFRDIIAPRLKLSNEEIQHGDFLIRHHMDCFQFDNWRNEQPIRRWLSRSIKKENFFRLDDLFYMFNSDIMGSGFWKPENILTVNRIETLVKKIINEKTPLSIKDLALSGQDIMKIMNVTRDEILKNPEKGQIIGKIQKTLLWYIVEVPRDNTKPILESLAKGIYEMGLYEDEDDRLF